MQSFVHFAIPADYLTSIQAQRATLQIELAKLSAIEAMLRQYAGPADLKAVGGGLQDADFLQDNASATPRRRRGRPAANKNAQQPSDETRVRPETVVLEALKAFGSQGGTLADIKLWVQQNYPGTVYAPHILRIALNRAWGSRKAAASERVGKGVDPIYYSLTERPATAVMASVSVKRAKQADIAA